MDLQRWPKDLVNYLLLFLDPISLTRLASTCQRYHATIVGNSEIWKPLFCREFPLVDASITSDDGWYLSFMKHWAVVCGCCSTSARSLKDVKMRRNVSKMALVINSIDWFIIPVDDNIRWRIRSWLMMLRYSLEVEVLDAVHWSFKRSARNLWKNMIQREY